MCAGIVPDPLQTLEPVASPGRAGVEEEMMLPAILDPWAGHTLHGAVNLARTRQAVRSGSSTSI